MRIIDCHAHLYSGTGGIGPLLAAADELGLAAMNLAAVPRAGAVNTNPAALVAKARHPERFFLFAALDHSARLVPGGPAGPDLAEQAERLAALGADGIKLLETKPTFRKVLDLPIDGEYFAPFFARVERLGLPLLWHAADPEEFWDPRLVPAWAARRGWAYDRSFVAKETVHAEVERVLARHPGLKVILAHFYFLSADLPRARRLLARFPGVHFDLAPGVELIFNLSREVGASRRFFAEHADRILFGTDIGLLPEAGVGQAVRRGALVRRFLESGETFGRDPEADFLLTPPEGAEGRGLALPAEALAKIYARNFQALAGERPRKLDLKLAREECLRLAGLYRPPPGDGPAALHPARAAEELGG